MVEFLVSEGHAGAMRYPLGQLFSDSALAEARVNGRIKTDAEIARAVSLGTMAGKDLLTDLLRNL